MLRTKRFLFMSWLLAILIAFVGVTRIQAQSILEGKITGTITDDKGEPLPGSDRGVDEPRVDGETCCRHLGERDICFPQSADRGL